MSRLSSLRSFSVLAALLSFACETAPAGAPAAADVLGAKTKGTMLQVTTLDPARCTWSRAGHELCVWQLGDRNSAWYALAESIPTKARVNLICEFPLDGTPRERACLALPAVSPPTVGSKRVRVSPSEAQSRLDAAGTVWDLTALVGDAPERCSNVDAETKFCVWRASTRTQGFATLVALLESRARVQVSCTLPADGSPRATGSCRVQPG